ncbi:DUF4917 family protein [Cupriavidus numazuensis]|uniref:DUF4917 domain-containing protein n=1 Tax=Cupriavidus numazuensis TaxID=221992 RepID=A0ABM8TMG0_9BURK|nr:hypothetical protein LMG26411_04679 [Cupriavidus numazuensis]
MPLPIVAWEELAHNYRGTILLGNGASIAVDRRFQYRSLLEHAREENLLPEDAQRLFDFFDTQDFELILRIVWQATNVNRSLQIPDEQTHAAYLRVRDCLIEAVRDVHPEYQEVREHLPHIHRFLREFNTVVSLNYDLIVYWATAYGLDIANRHSFKDCFVGGGLLHDDWRKLRRPIRGDLRTTLVFYPHGSLILCRNRVEQEQKIHNLDNGLLDAILQRWESEEVVPLFVCEGTAQQKINTIQGSYYLSTVYREVLASRQDNLTVYGWGFGEQDLHLLKRFAAAGIQRVAVSVYRGDQAYCRRVDEILHQGLGQNILVEFFDSESAGCWRYPAED